LPPLAAVVAWRAVLHLRFGAGRGLRDFGSAAVGWPLAWLPDRLASTLPPEEAAGLASLALALAAALATRRWTAATLTFALFAATPLFLSAHVFDGFYDYARALVALPLLAAVLAERAEGLQRWLLRGVSLGFFAVGAIAVAPRAFALGCVLAALFGVARLARRQAASA
jgi:hypothetical protein